MRTDVLFKTIETKEHIGKINTVIDYALSMLRGIEKNSQVKVKEFFNDRKEFYGYLSLTPEQSVKDLRSHLFSLFNMLKEHALKNLRRYSVSKEKKFSIQLYTDFVGQAIYKINDNVDLMRVKRILSNLEEAYEVVKAPDLPERDPEKTTPEMILEDTKKLNKNLEACELIEAGIKYYKELKEKYLKEIDNL